MLNFYPFLTYVFVTTFTPGPNNILSMTNGLRYGYRRTLGFLTGITSGFLIVMLISGLLNVAIVQIMPQIRFWLNIFGAAYMFYLAAHIIFSKSADEKAGKNDLNTFRAGFVLQFVNLKGILYGVTVFALFITPGLSEPGHRQPVCATAGLYRFYCRFQLGSGRQPVPQLLKKI